MKKSPIKLDKLVEITLALMKNKSLKDLSNIRLKKEKDNVWIQLAKKYYNKEYGYKDALNIYSWWNRNTQNYATLVKNKLSETISKPTLSIQITKYEWNHLKSKLFSNIKITNFIN